MRCVFPRFFLSFLLMMTVGCSSLPRPVVGKSASSRAVVVASPFPGLAAQVGDAQVRYQEVEVSFAGEWQRLCAKIQPVLVDEAFRRSSVERYERNSGRVTQVHQGPGGTKTVKRQRGQTTLVTYNGERSEDAEVVAAANLVVDAYSLFVFGHSWLAQQATPVRRLPERRIEGELCELFELEVRPGFGDAEADVVIAWVSKASGLLKRVQFSLNGLDSTRGADADVTFGDFKKAADGSVWPTHFLEVVRRPFVFKAHEWRLTGLKLNGKPAVLEDFR